MRRTRARIAAGLTLCQASAINRMSSNTMPRRSWAYRCGGNHQRNYNGIIRWVNEHSASGE